MVDEGGYFGFGWLRLGPIPVKNALGWYGLVASQRGVFGNPRAWLGARCSFVACHRKRTADHRREPLQNRFMQVIFAVDITLSKSL
jgi:hypothetical protein